MALDVSDEEAIRELKGADVDRWIAGMQRWQGSLFGAEHHPATWLTGKR